MNWEQSYALGEYPRRLRMALSIARMEPDTLAQSAGLNKKDVNKYYLGTKEPELSSLVKMCNALDVSADFLLGLSDDIQIHRLGKR